MTTDETTDRSGITLRHLTKRYGRTVVLRDVSLQLPPGRIYGLLGVNGAGKTTLMSVVCNHTFRTSGTVLLDGQDPAENAEVLARTCFVHEDQRYNDEYTVRHVLAILPAFYPGWDAELAGRLIERFRLPLATRTKKMSRGQRSALAIVAALASRAPYTFLDEPYLGLDPAARSIFYDELVAEYAEHPRTIVMSTHLIDEAARLMEEIVVLHDGAVVLRTDADHAARSAFVAHGLEQDVRAVLAGRPVLAERRLGPMVSVTVQGQLGADDEAAARRARVTVEPAGLQELVAALGIHSLLEDSEVSS